MTLCCHTSFFIMEIVGLTIIEREVNELLHHPFFFEEQMRFKNWELKQIDKHAWKWGHLNKKKASLPLSLMKSLWNKVL